MMDLEYLYRLTLVKVVKLNIMTIIKVIIVIISTYS